MAYNKNNSYKKKYKSSSKNNYKKTAKEIKSSFDKEKYDKEQLEKAISIFERNKEVVQQLVNPNNTENRIISTFSKEILRTYMRNPLAQYINLRNLSRFLYYRSQVYRRLIHYNANMIDLNFRSIIPLIDLEKGPDQKKMLKSYSDTAKVLENMNLTLEFLKAYIVCWREDTFYGCAYLDDTGFFILPLDPDYCKVTGIYKKGDLAFDMDMTYFRNRQEQLEMWGEPFISMYNEYSKDMANQRWQPMPDENCVCLKVNIEDWQTPLPPYMGLFSRLINLEDLDEIMAVADEQQIYKMITATIPLIKNSGEVDDFAVDPNTAIKYYNRLVEALPDYVNAIISPIPIDTISFDQDQANDVNKIEKATESILTISGGVQTLCPPSGTTAYTAAIRSDEEEAISSLLPQTEAILNRLISYQVSNPSKVKLLEVTKYTRDNYIENSQKLLNYGLPLSLTLGSLMGYSEVEIISQAHLQDTLNIRDLFKPLETASTRSSADSVGAPTKTDTEITDEGAASRDKKDRAN